MAVGVYYGHVGIMLVFNLFFNKKTPTFSFAYLFGLIINSLSSTYSYNYCNYDKLFEKKDDDQKLHQPSLIRQMLFYTIFLIETASLTCLSVYFFEEKASKGIPKISNIPITRGHLWTVIVFILGSQVLALLLRLVYYGMHPSSVSMSDLEAKKQIYILGREVRWNKKRNIDEESGTSTSYGKSTSTSDGKSTSTSDGKSTSTSDGKSTFTSDVESTSTSDGKSTSPVVGLSSPPDVTKPPPHINQTPMPTPSTDPRDIRIAEIEAVRTKRLLKNGKYLF